MIIKSPLNLATFLKIQKPMCCFFLSPKAVLLENIGAVARAAQTIFG